MDKSRATNIGLGRLFIHQILFSENLYWLENIIISLFLHPTPVFNILNLTLCNFQIYEWN